MGSVKSYAQKSKQAAKEKSRYAMEESPRATICSVAEYVLNKGEKKHYECKSSACRYDPAQYVDECGVKQRQSVSRTAHPAVL